MPVNGVSNQTFVYLPSITKADTDNWANHTEWINGTQHRFAGLTPFTTYNVTVYVRETNTDHVDPPYLYINVTTTEGKYHRMNMFRMSFEFILLFKVCPLSQSM